MQRPGMSRHGTLWDGLRTTTKSLGSKKIIENPSSSHQCDHDLESRPAPLAQICSSPSLYYAKESQKNSKGMLAPLAIAICRRPAAAKKTPNTKVPQPQAESTKHGNALCLFCFGSPPKLSVSFRCQCF